jgi:hypothetical protein
MPLYQLTFVVELESDHEAAVYVGHFAEEMSRTAEVIESDHFRAIAQEEAAARAGVEWGGR